MDDKQLQRALTFQALHRRDELLVLPNTGAATRMNRKLAPQMAASSSRRSRSAVRKAKYPAGWGRECCCWVGFWQSALRCRTNP